MSEGILTALPQFLRALPTPAADPRAGQKPADAFGDLLGKDDDRLARRPPPLPAASLPPSTPPAPLAPTSQAPVQAPASEQAPVAEPTPPDEAEDDTSPAEQPEKSKERAPDTWTGGLQQTAAPAPQEQQKAQAEQGEAANTAQAGAGLVEAGTQPKSLSSEMTAAAVALRQRLLGNGDEEQGEFPASTGAMASVETDAEAETSPEHSAVSRRSRAAVASVGLFQRGVRGDAEKAGTDRPAVEKDGQTPVLSKEATTPPDALPTPGGTDNRLSLSSPTFLGPETPKQVVSPKAFGTALAASLAGSAAANALSKVLKQDLPANRLTSLEVQLHPAELGSVTARMRMIDQQISVEILTDSANGRDSLAAQEGTIRASLEALGFRIDRLTIQQQPGIGGSAGNSPGTPSGQLPDGSISGGANGTRDGSGGRGNGHGRQGGSGQTGGESQGASSMPSRSLLGPAGVFI